MLSVARRAAYRVRQFITALRAIGHSPDEPDLAQARRALPDAGWRLFRTMPRSDQAHSLNVWRSLAASGYHQRALGQAALLHDVAKHVGGVTLLHRVAIVLVKAFSPATWRRIKALPEPSRRDLRYPLWAHANHPAGSAELAARAGCLPEAVDLIRRHQDPLPSSEHPSTGDALLLALQRADDDN